jgi:hypothetical protein
MTEMSNERPKLGITATLSPLDFITIEYKKFIHMNYNKEEISDCLTRHCQAGRSIPLNYTLRS